MELTWISVIPPLLAVALAFITRDAVVSLLVACFVGVLLLGEGISGFPDFLIRALASKDFIWVTLLEFNIGILVAFFQRSGAVKLFTEKVGSWVRTRRQVGGLGWGLGITIFFSDYFSPLFVGPVMRTLTDKYKISREKLAYICDSTSAPMIALIPFTGWAVYMGGLTIGIGPVTDQAAAMDLYIHSIPFNFYSFLAIGMVGLLAMNIIPDFGPMKKAEDRAKNEGKVLRDGAVPMMGKELTNLEVSTTGKPNIYLNFIIPIMLVVGINLTSFIVYGKIAILQSYLTVCSLFAITMILQKIDNLQGVMKTVMAGMKGVMPAVTILALAFCINTISRELKTAEYVVSLTEAWLLPNLLPMITFFLAGFISFSTGTSWGTYAIMIPIAMPLAFQFSGGEVNTLIYSTFAAVAGGGVFGDHCSPLSDTTVLSSLGSACDHIDHVKTQLPYTLIAGGIAMAFYLGLGFVG